MEVWKDKEFVNPVHLYLPKEEIETGALQQIINLATNRRITTPILIMPDCHQGYGAPIGSVFGSDNYLFPNAVGVDIGCGISFQKYNPIDYLTDDMVRAWEEIVREKVPIGFAMHKEKTYEPFGFDTSADQVAAYLGDRPDYQMGTLGTGNHFMEMLVGSNGDIYLAVHTGSRGLGHAFAQYHTNIANIHDPEGAATELASIAYDSKEGQSYYNDMWLSISYAEQNRSRILENMDYALREVATHVINNGYVQGTSHNFAHHARTPGGKYALYHMKGANRVQYDSLAMVPGSMGSPSYICSPKDPVSGAASFFSHGAGRAMSRGAARKSISMEQFAEKMAGTLTTITEGMIDESPLAYKDIETVMERQKDLMNVVDVLRPICTIKDEGRKGKKK
jgi:tRNA-splicing ligase RtcB